MKEKYLVLVNKTIQIIEEEVRKEKLSGYIMDVIYWNMVEIDINDIDHFDRYYFKKIVGIRIRSYIQRKQWEHAVYEYEKNKVDLNYKDTYKNVSHFKEKYELYKEGKTMKNYVLIDFYKIEDEDLRWMSDYETNDDFIVINGTCKEDVIKKYLYAKCKFESIVDVKMDIFEYLWTSTAGGDLEYIEEFKNKKEILELSDRIEKDFLINETREVEVILYESDTQELRDLYYSLLTEEELKKAYYLSNYLDVFCVELKSFCQYKKQETKNMKNIISDIEDIDIKILNYISEMVKKDNKECYCISLKDFMEGGFSEEEAKEYLIYIVMNNLKSSASYYYDDGGYVCVALLSSISYPMDMSLFDDNFFGYIYPSVYFRKLIEAGYDFRDGKNDVAKKVFDEIRMKNKFK